MREDGRSVHPLFLIRVHPCSSVVSFLQFSHTDVAEAVHIPLAVVLDGDDTLGERVVPDVRRLDAETIRDAEAFSRGVVARAPPPGVRPVSVVLSPGGLAQARRAGAGTGG